MGRYNIIQEKTIQFSTHLVRFLREIDAHETKVLEKQLLRSGTSVGANVEEVIGAQSTKDFF